MINTNKKNNNLGSMSPDRWMLNDWIAWFSLMVVAVILRVIFYTGYFGSDEVTYIANAFKILNGDWSVSQYVGANRYGVNIPIAFFAYLFGQNEFAASLYSLLCSIGEISLVFYFGRLMLGLRTAVLATIVLVFLPLHVHLAGRLMADSPLAFMMTASILFFWDGEKRNKIASFFVAGLAAGFCFWIKPQTVIYLLVFLIYPIVTWRWEWRWKWMLFGFIIAIAGNTILMWVLTSDPFYIFKAIQTRHISRHSGNYVDSNVNRSLVYYLTYLFIKIWHTWLVAYFAVATIIIWLSRRHSISSQENNSLFFLTWWTCGFLIIFSLLVVSWNPLAFIPKQTNYILMFVAPLALLAGYSLAQLRGVTFWVAISIVVLPSTMLSAMEQNTIHVFTANSKAIVKFAQQHKNAEVFSNTNPFRAASFHNITNPEEPKIKLNLISDLLDKDKNKDVSLPASSPKYVIIDTETLSWGAGDSIRDIKQVPRCWDQIGVLEPSQFGLGWWMLTAFQVTAEKLLPETIKQKIIPSLNKLTQPKPAYIYRVSQEKCHLDEP